MTSRSVSPYRSAENLAQILGLDPNEDPDQQENTTPDHSRVTSRGAPAQRSRRQRSEYRSWDRASDVPRQGTTGSRNRSKTRH
ncbi:uncharacterized protein N7503_002516 [Penicillium pulvis]|uniref:uncharacterized protein n=1 Tax=Penicillium pulvis TaxID=1562058 RepID=UPI00254936C8|nr:uncharacterized protein N7503_002516 [Penicillium pulvis]KAJ5565047.1 hypothetical protein N7513_001289 [Penicillium glabrum]KAJ5810298.1 hypothetical protein N7503_002516 [Penicillium pulvis]